MGTTLANPAQTAPKLSTAGANSIAIAAIRNNAVLKRIQLNPYTVNPANTPTLTVQLQNVGLLRGCLIKMVATVQNTDPANDALATGFAGANLLSQIVYNDLANVTRIQTTGHHLYMLDCLRRQGIMGAAYTHDVPGQFGALWKPFAAPTITHATTGTAEWYWYLPVAYSDTDLRGAVFSNITNANQSLQLTFNPTLCPASTVDAINSPWGATTTVSSLVWQSATVTVYQDIYDQLPDMRYLPSGLTPQDWIAATGDSSGLLLPTWSMRWMYELKYSPFAGVTQGVENPFPYTNQRQFLSTILKYDNGTAMPTGGRTLGTDLNYVRLVAANSYEWWKMDPTTCAFESRRIIGDDVPAGFYVFDTRQRPINTIVSGNLQLVIMPSLAVAGTASAVAYYEDFALVATVTGATSLASGTGV